jgi:hypothetical protein
MGGEVDVDLRHVINGGVPWAYTGVHVAMLLVVPTRARKIASQISPQASPSHQDMSHVYLY